MTADVLFPTSAAEAATLFGDGADVTVVGGGTILLPEIAAGRCGPDGRSCFTAAGLDALRIDDDRVVIGAMVPIAALSSIRLMLRSPVSPAHIADREVRESATVGGNLSAAGGTDSQRGDLGAPLIALGARVRSAGAGGERVDAIEDFLSGDRTRRLVLEVEYDRFDRRTGSTGLRRRHAHSFAIAGVVACARPDGSDLRIAVSGVGPTALRCRSGRGQP